MNLKPIAVSIALAGLALGGGGALAKSVEKAKPVAKAEAKHVETAAPAPDSLFKAQIAPILAANCATCHLTGEEVGHMSLAPSKAIASLVGQPAAGAPKLTRVVPGDPDKSYIVMKLEGTQIANGGAGARMSFGGTPLPPEQIALIRQWIKEGAKP